MSEKPSSSRSKLVLFAAAAVLLVAAIAFGISRLGKASGEEGAGQPGKTSTAGRGAPRYSEETTPGLRHDGKTEDKTEEERIAGKPVPLRQRESPKEMVARVSAEAEEELKMLQGKVRKSSLDPEREERLTFLIQAQNHWRMAEEVSKNPSLRGEAAALNRKLAQWVENSGQMDKESFQAGFMALRTELGNLRKRSGATRRPTANRAPTPQVPR